MHSTQNVHLLWTPFCSLTMPLDQQTTARLFVRGGYQPRPQGLLVIQYGGGGQAFVQRDQNKQS